MLFIKYSFFCHWVFFMLLGHYEYCCYENFVYTLGHVYKVRCVSSTLVENARRRCYKLFCLVIFYGYSMCF